MSANKKTARIAFFHCLIALALFQCTGKDTLFEKISSFKSNIAFQNSIEETEDFNVLHYDYIYNGAGVAVGDLNNDGLPDLYFNGNSVSNKLYINKGDFEFEDWTEVANVSGKNGWKTGVSMADVNADGLLDIYVCYAGLSDQDRSNQLFINNGPNGDGKITFIDKAKEFGIDAPDTYSTQSYFFDYDMDGDLDMFLLNHGVNYQSSFSNAIQRKAERHQQFGNRLYRNDSGFFKDVSDETGIAGGWLNYGLSASVSDFNSDGFPDLYVSNDFDERDFFYLNNGDGTFREALKECFPHISKFTMGTDAADFNNDNYPDLVTLDMLPEDNYRQKLLKGPDSFDKYDYFVKRGFHYQQMRNMLHLNRGIDENGIPVFSEIGQLAGISNTDWSWSSLFADFDNDGYKDLFISNGYLRDFTNLDFQKYDFEEARQKLVAQGKNMKSPEGKKFMFEYVNKMSSIKVSNYAFRNTGNLRFENTTKQWGLSEENLSNGAVYADLDNDGDLDLVVNNLNEKAGVYRNNSDRVHKNNFLNIKLSGPKKNKLGVGARLYVKTAEGDQFLEANHSRGFLSSVDQLMHFGLGKAAMANEVKVIWPDQKESVLHNVKVNQTVLIRYEESVAVTSHVDEHKIELTLLHNVTDSSLSFQHRENIFVDYKNERLLLNRYSDQGPKVSVADVNNDGMDDVFIGGASGQAAELFLQQARGGFRKSESQPWSVDINCEDVASVFFDCDGDKDLDLYVVSGGNEFDKKSIEYQDRLYINNGNGVFSRSDKSIPSRNGSGSCVAAADYDGDGDVDLFVGGWTLPGSFPRCSPSRILRNETKTQHILFVDVTAQVCPSLDSVGITHDAEWVDYDRDGLIDLVIAGEWMPIKIYRNQNGVLTDEITKSALARTNGFWRTIAPRDLDKDGDIDFIIGNVGLNSELKASMDQPLRMYSGDFDKDGRIDPIICNYIQGKSYPVATRDELLSQVLPFRKKFIRYSQYADVTINEILDSAQLRKCNVNEIYELKSSLLMNDGNKKFRLIPLPTEVQFAPIQSVLTDDFDGDSTDDILIAGNFYSYRAEYGPFDASVGTLLTGDGKGNFKPVTRSRSGVLIRGDVRDMVELKSGSEKWIIVTKNNSNVQILSTKP